jgi:hypothetical protein
MAITERCGSERRRDAAMRRARVLSPASAACLFGIAASALPACLPSLDAFVVTPPSDAGALPIDGPSSDAPSSDAASTDPSADAGFAPTAIDRACAIPWTDLEPGASGACAGRSIVTLTGPAPVPPLAVARAADGTLTLAYQYRAVADSAEIRTRRFHEGDLAMIADGPTITPLVPFGELLGGALAIATDADSTHHLAYWVLADAGNDVRLVSLREGDLAAQEVVTTGLGPLGALDVEVDDLELVNVVWHDDTSGIQAARQRGTDGVWGLVWTLDRDVADASVAGPGAIALARGARGAMHAAWQRSSRDTSSSPSYGIGVTGSWSTARTLDNALLATRLSGISTDLAVIGDDEVVAVYLDWTSGIAGLRLARFDAPGGDVEITALAGDMTLESAPPRHPIVIHADSRGWLHLLTAHGFESAELPSETLLTYRRQTLVAGELEWIEDVVAHFDEPPSLITISMVIGPDRRPHIAYWEPTDGVIRYATILPDAI